MMKFPLLIAALTVMGLTATQAQLATYSQDFEGLNALTAGAGPLGDDGWEIFGNVTTTVPDVDCPGGYCFGYGKFPAPNLTGAFSSISVGEGGAEQGGQGLVVFSDYENLQHLTATRLIESNIFQEQTIGAADAGNEWVFQFDGKLGDIIAPTTAVAFLKTLDPFNSFATTTFLTIDVTVFPTIWGTHMIPFTIPSDGSLTGQILQFGFNSTAKEYEASGMQYDNVFFFPSNPPEIPPIVITSFDKTGTTVRIDFESTEDAFYGLEKLVDEGTGWVEVDCFQAFGATEFLRDLSATEGTALYRVVEKGSCPL